MAKRKRNKTTSARQVAVPAPAGPRTGFADMLWDQKIVWVCLHLLLFLVPVAMGNLTFLGIGGGMPLTYDQFDIAKLFVMRALTLIALGAWGAGILLNGGKLRRTRIDWIILGFLAWVLVSSFLSIHVETAIFGKYRRFEGWLSFVNYALVFFLVVQIADRASRIRSLCRTLVISSILVTGYGLLQYLNRDPISWGTLPFEQTRSFSTYGNPDLLGGFLVLALTVSLAMALSEASRVWKFVYWCAFLMLSAVMITAFTRSAWVGGFVAACAMVWALWRARVKFQPVDWAFAGAAVLAVAAIIVRSLSMQHIVLNFWLRFISIFEFGEGSAASRFEIWKAAIKAIEMRPVFGFGADTFRLVFPFTKTEAYVQQVGYLSVADNVHNYPLQLMAGIGIPGFLIMYGMIAYALVLAAPLAFRRDPGPVGLVQAGLWTAVIGYVFHLLFGLSVTGTTVIFWALMGLMLAPTVRSTVVEPMRAGAAAPRLLGTAFVIAVVVILSVFNVRYVVADHYYLMGRIGPYDVPTRVQLINRAIELNPSNDMYRAEVGLQYTSAVHALAGRIQQEAQGGDTSQARTAMRAEVERAEAALLSVIEFIPPEYDNYVFLSNLYNIAGEFLDPVYFGKAIEIARRGVEVEYYGPAVRLQLARALLGSGRIDEAIEELAFATRVDPNYFEARSLHVSLLINRGRTQEAREVLRTMLAANPDDAFAKEQMARLAETTSTDATEATSVP